MAEVGNTAVRIGDQLSSMDKHRIRANEAKELIEYFDDFKTNSVNRLNGYRAEGYDGEFKTAVIARRLSTIAKELDMPEMEQVHCSNRPILILINTAKN